MSKTLVWAAGLQAKLISNMIKNIDDRSLVFFDDYLKEPLFECEYFISDFNRLLSMKSEFDEFIVAIGNHHGQKRNQISLDLENNWKLKPLSLINARSYMCHTSCYEPPILIMPGAIVHSFASIGRDCILNTGCIIEHEVTLRQGVHIMPGAVLTGRVYVHEYATIGANATILPGLTIGQGAYVGAGSVVTKDVLPGTIVKGNPAC